MKFEEWIKEASEDLEKAVGVNTHNSDIWNTGVHQNTHKAQMFPYYLQYRMWVANRSLVWATWGLAIATIILSGVTLYFQYKK